jgi:hypothetical protein
MRVRTSSHGKTRAAAVGPVRKVLQVLRAAIAGWDNYRPEVHYMRGPGPKCRSQSAPGNLAGVLVASSGRYATAILPSIGLAMTCGAASARRCVVSKPPRS